MSGIIHPNPGTAREFRERGWHVRSLLLTLAFTIPLLFLAGRGYFSAVPEGTSFSGWLVSLLALFSTAIMYLVLLSIPLAPLTILLQNWWITAVVVPSLLGMFCAFIYADSIVFQLFGIHFNGMVWNLLTTAGAGDSVSAGVSTVLSGILAVVLCVGSELAFSLAGLRYLERSAPFRAFFRRRNVALILVGAFLVVLLDKSIYAWGDLHDDEEVTRSRSLFLLYQPVTIKRFAVRHLGYDLNKNASVNMRTRTKSLAYPRSPLKFAPDGKRPNIVVIGVEGGRFDMLDAHVMPFLTKWRRTNLSFDNHYSGGNCSRFGIFTLLYGIGGSYWHTVLAERQSPVLMSELAKMGYDFSILSCTDLNFPEFRKTAFLDVADAITDKWPCDRVDRDRLMTDAFLAYLEEREEPFFSFMFYDASHQMYSYPESHAVFATDLSPGSVNYVTLATNIQKYAPALKARFKNSLHYIDSQIERAITGLEQRGLLENTIVIVTGDHGEEFGELGKFGHNNTFSRYQTGTFMVAHVPGEEARHITRMTSHMDLVATLFGHMGIENPRSDYTLGTPLLDAVGPSYVYIASWDDAAIVDEETIIRFGLEVYNASMTVLDHEYRVAPKDARDTALAERRNVLFEVLRGMKAFAK